MGQCHAAPAPAARPESNTMSFRHVINQHAAAVTVAAIVLVCLALGILVWTGRGDHRPAMPRAHYFYDLGADELLTADRQQIPPIPGVADEPAVRAYLFACGAQSCPDAEQLLGLSWRQIQEQTSAFVAYFERYTDDARDVLTATFPAPDPDAYERAAIEGRLQRAPDARQWSPIRSNAIYELHARVAERCPPEQALTACLP